MQPAGSLPDLDILNREALKVLIVSQHDQLRAKEEQLQARDQEIEHLKLLLAQLRRMQFGRKSEKLARQIEQLELKLENLQTERAEAVPAEPPHPCPAEPLFRNSSIIALSCSRTR